MGVFIEMGGREDLVMGKEYLATWLWIFIKRYMVVLSVSILFYVCMYVLFSSDSHIRSSFPTTRWILGN